MSRILMTKEQLARYKMPFAIVMEPRKAAKQWGDPMSEQVYLQWGKNLWRLNQKDGEVMQSRLPLHIYNIMNETK